MQKIPPFDLVQKLLYLDGKPFSLSGRDYLSAIYNSPAKKHVYMTGRQSEKSSTLAARLCLHGVCIPNFRCLYVSPTSKQSRVFSSDRMKPFLMSSPLIKKHLIDKDCDQAVFRKSLKNGSVFYFEYCFLTPDRVRGISSDFIAVDEVDDIRSDFIPVIEETSSHSRHKIIAFAGTPKTFDGSLQYYWENSTQREIATKCQSCNFWNVGLGEANISREFLMCAKCNKKLSKSQSEWVRAYPLDQKQFDGFHINQLQVPWLEWAEIIAKQDIYPRGRFNNEVLGLPYDSGSKPITLQEVMACCADRSMDEVNGRYSSPMFAGVDYGLFGEAGKTVLCIGYFSPYPEKFKVVYARMYDKAMSDRKLQMDDIISTCRRFNVSAIGADFGVAGESNIALATEFGADRVVQFFHTGNQNERIKYNQKRWMYTLNRTFVMTDLFLDLKHRTIEFFKWDEFKPFGEHILNIYSDVRESFQKEMLFYDHRVDKNDDFFHSLLYCKLAAGIFFEGRAI